MSTVYKIHCVKTDEWYRGEDGRFTKDPSDAKVYPKLWQARSAITQFRKHHPYNPNAKHTLEVLEYGLTLCKKVYTS